MMLLRPASPRAPKALPPLPPAAPSPFDLLVDAAKDLALLPAPWVPCFRPALGEPGGIEWMGRIDTGAGVWETYMEDQERGTSRRTLGAVEALCALRGQLDHLVRLVRVGLAPERARLVTRPAPRPSPRLVHDPRSRTRGRGARHPRLCQGHRFRASAMLVYADAPQSSSPLAEELLRLQVALAPLPPPWSADVDDEERDGRGKLAAGCWTGKVYTGRRGSWCWYHTWESGVVYAPIVEALCALRNVLDEALAAARAGATIEHDLIVGASRERERKRR